MTRKEWVDMDHKLGITHNTCSYTKRLKASGEGKVYKIFKGKNLQLKIGSSKKYFDIKDFISIF